MKKILASASERRKELLSRIISDYKIIVSDFDEDKVVFQGDVSRYVEEIAYWKGKTVAEKFNLNDSIVISADTVVTFQGEILGKPKNEEEAFFMLKRLSGNCHKVYSGISLINTSTGKIINDSVCTEVKFSNLSDEDIKKYINTKEPMDKAGAYGIQGYGGVFVEEIKGCYYNVVGLPLNRLKRLLKEI
ncbi:Maf-like protein [Clostridium fallax]|uniref:dTTP/UTP pyrophosphatase n=1 Tax=Clostridium fallax TaxID=1533 RepID=A0A1M4VBA4_9CLOT|nr:Maf-like protein [Clostridium fallax]SHE66239.1 septum formation protein [Clostridium fallax]SQB05801.1 Maf-like protein [Clostridium fallax]